MKPEVVQIVNGILAAGQNITLFYLAYKGWDRGVSYFEKKLEHPESYVRPGVDEPYVEPHA